MSEPQTSASPVETVPKTPSSLHLWLVGIVALVALSILAWLAPAYKKVVKDVQTLTKENQDLQSKLDIASKAKVTSRTYYPTGKLASETTSETSTDTREVTDNRSSSSDATRSHQETVTKRGTSSIGLFWGDSFIPKEANADYLIFNPLSIQSEVHFYPFEILGGIKCSF